MSILEHISVVPYSVLGVQLTRKGFNGTFVRNAHPPSSDCLFVDPAGLEFIHKLGPSKAGGASAAIYNYIGIREFPTPVRKAVRKTGDAYWYSYNGTYNCCHVVGPNFTTMVPPPTEKVAIDFLTFVYKNIFTQFARSKLLKLRLLPVSGGIFSGIFHKRIPELTFIAIKTAVGKLNKKDFEHLANAIKKNSIEMCIYEELHFGEFRKTLKLLRG